MQYKNNVVNKLLVHCWVSGALSPYCVPDWLMDVTLCGGVCCWFGVLCENCIVDASICMMPLTRCVCGVCVCDVIFLFCLFCQVHLLLPYMDCVTFVLCGLCVVVGVWFV